MTCPDEHGWLAEGLEPIPVCQTSITVSKYRVELHTRCRVAAPVCCIHMTVQLQLHVLHACMSQKEGVFCVLDTGSLAD